MEEILVDCPAGLPATVCGHLRKLRKLTRIRRSAGRISIKENMVFGMNIWMFPVPGVRVADTGILGDRGHEPIPHVDIPSAD